MCRVTVAGRNKSDPEVAITFGGHRLLSLYHGEIVSHYFCENTLGVWGLVPNGVSHKVVFKDG